MQSDKKTITLQTLTDFFGKSSKSNRGCGFITIAIIAAILLLSVVTAVTGFIWLFIIIICPLIGVCIASLRHGKKYKKVTNEKDFYIVTDICCEKQVFSDSDGDSYSFVFSNAGEYHCGDSFTKYYAPKYLGSDWLYNNTHIGDRFYLLYIGEKKKPEISLPQRFCQLDMSGFTEENGVIRPKK